MAMFYHFSQNNSGGSFDFDKNDGITHHVVIEAVSAESANKKLQDIGGYFDGCDTGRDCSCCGDRWYEADECDAESYPHAYSQHVKNFNGMRWFEDKQEICVHYLDGKKEWF